MSLEAPRIGLIGAGSIAAYHADGLRAAGAVVQAVATRSPDSAVAAARRFGIPAAAQDWRALLARSDLDAVIVATPDDTHEEIGLAAIQSSMPLLMQKPLAPSVAAAERLVTASRAAGVPLWTSYMHRHMPEVRAWRVLAGSAPLGDILSVRLRNATPGPDWGDWYFDGARTGGVVMQLGIHGIDLVQHLFGDIADVAATTAVRLPERRFPDGRIVRPTAPDHAFATYRLASGIIVSHEMCFCEPAGTDRFAMTVTGTRGQAEFRGARGPLAIHDGKGWTQPVVPPEDAGVAQHRQWVAMLRGEMPDDGSAEAGLRGVRVAEAVLEAARSGRRMALSAAGAIA
jgi:predicted dehydrogenase